MVGDGYCDDVTNNVICNFDDGDCCSPEIITSFCTECQCLNGCIYPNIVGDGKCDDITNNIECNYDGGDCCSHEVKTSFCTECQCLSFEDGSELPISSGGTK